MRRGQLPRNSFVPQDTWRSPQLSPRKTDTAAKDAKEWKHFEMFRRLLAGFPAGDVRKVDPPAADFRVETSHGPLGIELARIINAPRREQERLRNSAVPSSRGGAGAGGGEPRLCRDGGGAGEGAHTPFGLGRAAAANLRAGRIRLREVWRPAAALGVREASGSRASYCGAPGLAHGRCQPDPGASATPGRVVLRPAPPQPTGPSPLLP